MKRKGDNSLPSPTKSSSWSEHGDSTTAEMTPATIAVRTDRAITLYRHVQILVGISFTSLGAFSIVVIPLPALLALLISLGSFALIVKLCIQWIRSEIQEIMDGHGIGPYLPSYVYNQLTEMTLHEWMQDTTLTQQYRHLILYFIPGITPERIDHYIDSLAPHQRSYLRRRGLGHLFGQEFMRLIMGNEGYIRHSSQDTPRPTEVHLIRSLPPELMNEEESDLGSTGPEKTISLTSNNPTHLEGQITDMPSPPAIVSFQDNIPEQVEDILLSNALMEMFHNYMNASIEALSFGLVSIVDTWTPYLVRTGIGVTSLAAGLGIFRRNWTPTITNSSTMTLWLPSHRTLWTTAFIGGLTTGGFLLVQANMRSIISRKARNNSTKETQNQEKNTKSSKS
jgi:hypothetical protein